MARLIKCECGHVARGETDDDVVDAIREHMRTDHAALFESVDRAEVYGWIQVD